MCVHVTLIAPFDRCLRTANRSSKHVFPTPESPISKSLNRWSLGKKVSCIVPCCNSYLPISGWGGGIKGAFNSIPLIASSPGPSQILSRSRGEKSGEGLGAKLRHGPEMVDSVSTNRVHVTYYRVHHFRSVT